MPQHLNLSSPVVTWDDVIAKAREIAVDRRTTTSTAMLLATLVTMIRQEQVR